MYSNKLHTMLDTRTGSPIQRFHTSATLSCRRYLINNLDYQVTIVAQSAIEEYRSTSEEPWLREFLISLQPWILGRTTVISRSSHRRHNVAYQWPCRKAKSRSSSLHPTRIIIHLNNLYNPNTNTEYTNSRVAKIDSGHSDLSCHS